MSKCEFIARNGLIINKLRLGLASYNKINFFVQNQGSVDGYNYSISQRILQPDTRDIEQIHKIEIKFDYANKVYYISSEEDDKLGHEYWKHLIYLTPLTPPSEFRSTSISRADNPKEPSTSTDYCMPCEIIC